MSKKPSHYWNHRIIKTDKLNSDFKEGYYQMHEVYYRNNKPYMWTENSIGVGGDNLKDIKQTLNWMLKALKKPVLKIVGKKLVEIKA